MAGCVFQSYLRGRNLDLFALSLLVCAYCYCMRCALIWYPYRCILTFLSWEPLLDIPGCFWLVLLSALNS